MKQNKAQWLSCGQVKEESIIEGVVEDISQYKERYYRQHFIMVTKLLVRTNGKKYIVQFNTPIEKDLEPPILSSQQQVIFYGSWKNDIFHANRYVS